ncbi:hypothetical protein IWX49DRAFT_12611 [Phyllosticta citricarpa]
MHPSTFSHSNPYIHTPLLFQFQRVNKQTNKKRKKKKKKKPLSLHRQGIELGSPRLCRRRLQRQIRQCHPPGGHRSSGFACCPVASGVLDHCNHDGIFCWSGRGGLTVRGYIWGRWALDGLRQVFEVFEVEEGKEGKGRKKIDVQHSRRRKSPLLHVQCKNTLHSHDRVLWRSTAICWLSHHLVGRGGGLSPNGMD